MNNPVKLVDKDGKRPDFPPGAFGQPDNIKASAIQQKVEPMMVEAARPAAMSTNYGASGSYLYGGGVSQSQTVLLKGQDNGTGNIYNKTNLGSGTPGADFSVGLEFTFLQGDSFLFNAQSLEGASKDQTVTAGGGGVVISLTKSTATTPEGGEVKSYGIKIGVGTSGIGYSVTDGNSTQIAGAQGSKEKEKQKDQYKEQQAEKQKQQNSQTMVSSFWNWMTNN